jgi:hypothetical protein
MYQRMMTMGVITRILINNGDFDYFSLGYLRIWSLCRLDQVFDVCHFVTILSSYECGNSSKDRLEMIWRSTYLLIVSCGVDES